MDSEGNGFPVTRWLTGSSAYHSWQSVMVSHRAVDHLKSWDSLIKMSPPDQHVDLDIWHGKIIFKVSLYFIHNGTLKIFFPWQISRSICRSAGLVLIDESQLFKWSTALWDTIMDCQNWYAELTVNHLVTGNPLPSDVIMCTYVRHYADTFGVSQWHATSCENRDAPNC